MTNHENLKGAARREYGLRQLDKGLTAAQVARIMDVSESTIHRWFMNRGREFGKHGGSRRFELSDWEQSQLFDFVKKFVPSEIGNSGSNIDRDTPCTENCASCTCEQKILEIIRLLCPRSCTSSDSIWSTNMVRELIRIQYPNSAQAHWTTAQVEKWLIVNGLRKSARGWKRDDAYAEDEDAEFRRSPLDLGYADFLIE